MLQTQSLNRRNIDLIEPLYQRFRLEALPQYQWADEPVDFETLKAAFNSQFLKGIVALEPGKDEPAGFMLYVYEDYRAVELNLTYLRDTYAEGDRSWKSIIDCLMMSFLAEIKNRGGWESVSYPMLGIQDRYVETLPWYGFQPVGQTIQKFDFVNELCLPVLGRQHNKMPPLPEGYTLLNWSQPEFKPKYKEDVITSIYEAFHKANDARWDPRFKTEDGAKRAFSAMTDGRMGVFSPECTSVLIHQESDTAVGFCFMIHTDVTKANIPLVGLRPEHKGKGLGNQLIRHTLMACIKRIIDGVMLLTEITATVDTDNVFALKMYRRFGFQETHNYPHCYLNPETSAKSYYGKTIFTENKLAGCCAH